MSCLVDGACAPSSFSIAARTIVVQTALNARNHAGDAHIGG
jgi:hypothetical protein